MNILAAGDSATDLACRLIPFVIFNLLCRKVACRLRGYYPGGIPLASPPLVCAAFAAFPHGKMAKTGNLTHQSPTFLIPQGEHYVSSPAMVCVFFLAALALAATASAAGHGDAAALDPIMGEFAGTLTPDGGRPSRPRPK